MSSSPAGGGGQGNDPRQPWTAKPYVPPPVSPQDLPFDYPGFIAVVFGIIGLMFRYKLGSWLAIIFCAQALANMRNIETDLKQITMAFMFAIMGLVNNFMASSRSSSTQR
ncbi:Protein Asterix [Acorus calamus]|uniref:Protein Asterix n=1 Tax=Acorus calamus TaxID=4465 RepID=A0AAV9EX91_ACOCL|nr:Protein Asterix [Acorus calamus]